jgi:hypothetical protein
VKREGDFTTDNFNIRAKVWKLLIFEWILLLEFFLKIVLKEKSVEPSILKL